MQVIRLFKSENYTEDELRMAHDYLLTIDYDVLITYIDNIEDIEIYLIALDLILKIYEKREEYERCFSIKKKIDSANNIINKKIKVTENGTT